MRKLEYILAGLLCAGMLCIAVGCSTKGDDSSQHSEESMADPAPTEETTEDPSRGQTIYWLGEYDLNPVEGEGRSAALAMYEDMYDGSVEWIPCGHDDKYTVLSSRILGGDPVDMVAYDVETLPERVHQGQYQPLDDFLDLTDEIWDGMREEIELFAYHGSRYVVPYAISEPVLLTYSRTLCEENGLEDPYALYQDGKWDWDAFLEMMQTFVANNESRTKRYGIAGKFGHALVQSTGKTIVQFDGSRFTSHIADAEIEAAENLMAEIRVQKLYDPTLYINYPTNGNVLFFGMADWSLAASNARNPDADLMAVPFPKMPDSDSCYLSGSLEAKMLVKNSGKGEAVAAYITCERLARTQEEFAADAREKALEREISASGQVMGFVTEEQYDAIAAYKETLPLVFEFGFGMGDAMYSEGKNTFESRGIMNNLTDGILLYDTSWEALREMYAPAIEDVLKPYHSAPAAQ